MDEIKLFKWFMGLGLPFMFFLILFLVLLVNESGSGSDNIVVASSGFSVPFENNSYYSITSNFGTRLDPFGSGTYAFHSGIDLGASCGTNVVASASGTVYEVGYSETGLGNYVYIEHNTDLGTLYTAYGHMLDDSIVVEKDQVINTGDLIGQVGSTGNSTGCHLHFMVMKGKISFEKEDLIDPYYIVVGLS